MVWAAMNRDMTLRDWRDRARDLRAALIEAEREIERAEQLALKNSPLVQAVLEAARQPVK